MDVKQAQLQVELENLLKQASRVAAKIGKLKRGKRIPHYDEIELPAHELGKQFSRMIQQEQAGDVATEGLDDAPCPDCQKRCRVITKTREVQSMDGPLEVTEPVAHCRRCRRSFFPSAGQLGT